MEQGREQCGNKEAVKGIFCICFHFNLWFVSKCKEKNLKKTVQRFRWGDEKLETLIKCLARGLYFESDLVKLYSDVQVKMAVWQKWPVEETSMKGDMTTEDIAKHKLIVSAEKKLTEQGYLYIKKKIKHVR